MTFMIAVLIIPTLLFAIETAPRISDREIIEGLADIRGDIKEIRANILRLQEGQRRPPMKYKRQRCFMSFLPDSLYMRIFYNFSILCQKP